VLPKERDAERPIGAFERTLQTLYVVNVGGNNLGTELGQLCRLVRVDVSCKCARGEAATDITQDGADQAAALRAGCTHHSDHLLFCHIESSLYSWDSLGRSIMDQS
jgi:hypothetical protein